MLIQNDGHLTMSVLTSHAARFSGSSDQTEAAKQPFLGSYPTLMPLTSGTVRIFGHNLATEVKAIRSLLGVVFQHPGLDGKLTVVENLRHHGHLYGIAGRILHHRITELLECFGVSDRAKERVEILSGGLQRTR